MPMLGFLPTLSPSELLIVGVVAVLLFGSRLPAVARSAGKSLSEFRRGMNDLQGEFRTAMREADNAAASAPTKSLSAPAASDGDAIQASEPIDQTASDGPSADEDVDPALAAGYPESTPPPYAKD